MGSNINSYPDDSSISVDDKVLGSSESGITFNYPLGKIMEDVGTQYFPPLIPEGAEQVSGSTTIELSDSREGINYSDNNTGLTGALSIDLISKVEGGYSNVKWTSPDGSLPTITILNGTGLGVGGADITTVNYLNSLSGAGTNVYTFFYEFGEVKCIIEGGGASSGGDTTAPLISGFSISNANPTRIEFVSNEIITATTFGGFTLGSGKTISGIFINTGQLTGHYFTVNSAYTNGDGNDTIAYSGAGCDLADASLNPLATFGSPTPVTVTNNVSASVTYKITMTEADKLRAAIAGMPDLSGDGAYVEFKFRSTDTAKQFTFLGLSTTAADFFQKNTTATGILEERDPTGASGIVAGVSTLGDTNWHIVRMTNTSDTALTFDIDGGSGGGGETQTRTPSKPLSLAFDQAFSRAANSASAYAYEYSVGEIEYIDFNGDLLYFKNTGATHVSESGNITLTLTVGSGITLADLFTAI